MQNRKPHSQKAPQTGHSIFGTILFSLLAVLAVEILLLTFAVHATRLGPQLNQNAEDHFPALAAGQLDLHGKVAAAGKDAAGEPCRVGVKGDHLLLRAGAGRLGAGEVDGGLEQVRLALRVLADDDVDRGIEGHALVRVVAEMLQRDGVKSHIRR